MEKLTVVIDNLPDGTIQHFYDTAIKSAPEKYDLTTINIKVEDTIHYDYEKILGLVTKYGISQMLTAMIAPHVIEIFDKKRQDKNN